MRDAVKAMYPNENWATQVDKMADDQVTAVYLRNLQNPPPLPKKEESPQQGKLF
jgi:hypothetical protein